MTVPPRPDDLAGRVRDAATPEERAALLGLDFDAVVAADRRLRWQSRLLIGVAALAIVLPITMPRLVALPGHANAVEMLVGALLTLVLLIAAMFLPSAVLGAPALRNLRSRDRQLIFVAAIEVLSVGALVLVAALSSTTEWLTGVLIAAVASQGLSVVGHLSLKSALVKNSTQLVPLARELGELPDWLSPVRAGTGRIIWALSASALSAAGAALLVWTTPLLAIAAAGVLVASGATAVWAASHNKPSTWLGVQIIAAVLMFTAGVVLFTATA